MEKKSIFVQDFISRLDSVYKKAKKVLIGGITVLALLIAPVDAMAEADYQPNYQQLEAISDISSDTSDTTTQIWAAKDSADSLLREWNENLDIVAALEENWDGEDSMAIREDVIETGRHIITLGQKYLPMLQNISPMPFGSLVLDWKTADGEIELEFTGKEMTFIQYFDDSRKPYASGRVPVTEGNIDLLFQRLETSLI